MLFEKDTVNIFEYEMRQLLYVYVMAWASIDNGKWIHSAWMK